jgi:serine protease Do
MEAGRQKKFSSRWNKPLFSTVLMLRTKQWGIRMSAHHKTQAVGKGCRSFLKSMRCAGSGVSVAAVLAFMGMGAPTSTAANSRGACDGATIIAHALPAIVNITVVKVIRGTDAASGKPDGPHFAVFVGSGAVVDPSGIIVTNKHVIQDAALISVTFHDKSEVPAQLVAAASLVDIAVLKVDLPQPASVLRFGDSDAVAIGQPVIAVGNPLGLGTSVSIGVVSALDRDLKRTPFDDFIQTDATINPGNSGGPLLNCTGEIIGIDTALLSNSKVLGSIGIGFALPSNDVRFVASRLLHPDTARPNWIGLHLQTLTARLATLFGRLNGEGAIVTGVDADSPAAHASLKAGDIITSVEGLPSPDASAVLRAVLLKPSGESISLSVWRRGQMTEVTVRGQPWPHMMALRSEVLASRADVARAQAAGLGLHLTNVTAADRRHRDLPDGVGVLIDRVASDSEAEHAGLNAGDVIEQVGDRPARTPEAVTSQLTDGDIAADDAVALLVHRSADARWITMYLRCLEIADLLAAPIMPASAGQASNAEAGPK